jgi:hypothetical protein
MYGNRLQEEARHTLHSDLCSLLLVRLPLCNLVLTRVIKQSITECVKLCGTPTSSSLLSPRPTGSFYLRSVALGGQLTRRPVYLHTYLHTHTQPWVFMAAMEATT